MIKTHRIKFLDHFVFLILILYLTELFRFFIILGIPLNLVAVLFISILSIFCISNRNLIKIMIKNKSAKTFTFLLLFFPIIIGLFHLILNFSSINNQVRPIGNQFLYLLLFYSTLIIGWKYELKIIFKWIINPTVLIVVCGLLYNYVNPAIFIKLKLAILGFEKEISSDDLSQVERVSGFYLKSTYASICLIPLLFFTFNSEKIYSNRRNLFTLCMIIILLFITGSRSALIFILFSLYFMNKLMAKSIYQSGLKDFKKSRKISNILIIFFFLGAFLGLEAVSSYLSEKGYEVIGNRLNSITSFEKISNDRSVNQRLDAQTFYLQKIIENPIFGYGQNYMDDLRKTQELLSSHNSYLENTFRYGIIYLIIFFLFMFYLWKSRERKLFESRFHFDFLGLLTVFLFISSFSSNTLLENKTVIILLGISFGLSIFDSKSINSTPKHV